MKTKILPGLLVILAFSTVVFAQSVKVTPQKVTYKRPKPLMDFKKTFSVTYPKVSGLTPALNKKVESAISFEKNFDFNLKEEITEIQWLEETHFNVDYNKNGILSITLTVMGTGAYPSTYNKSVVVNLKTGNQVKPQNVFNDLAKLSAQIKKAQQAEMKKALEEIEREYKEEKDFAAEYFQNTDFTAENLDEISVGDNGVTFIYDYGFPHAAKALEPEGRYFFSWSQLKPFIKPDGLLGQFVR